VLPHPLTVDLTPAGLNVTTTIPTHPSWMHNSGYAVGIALLMLNIQGIDKEVLEPVRLNRTRIASGKPAVPRHTLMQIEHVYASDGKRVAVGDSKCQRQLPVHMSDGQVRRLNYAE